MLYTAHRTVLANHALENQLLVFFITKVSQNYFYGEACDLLYDTISPQTISIYLSHTVFNKARGGIELKNAAENAS